MFTIDFIHTITCNLPEAQRSQFNISLHRYWLSEVSKMHDRYVKTGLILYNEARTTAQIGSMVQQLNALFDPDNNRIYITDVEWIADEYLFLDGEPYEDMWLFLDVETLPEGAEEVYLYGDDELNPYQFIVWIPAELSTDALLEQIAAEVNKHKYAGKYYQIQIIPE